MLPSNIHPREIPEWVNWHRNIKQKISGYFDIENVSDPSGIKSYKKTVASIQRLLGEASKRNEQVRAFGGAWSFSDVAVSSGWMVDTSYLGLMFEISDKYKGDAYVQGNKQVFLVQAGTKISEINRNLEVNFGCSLNTTGASNGQTIAGAIATGTHGSAIGQGGIQNHVIGIHLIVGPDRHVWVERKSDPATKGDFAGLIGAELKRDDDLFSAALVSLGGFGFISSVMIQTAPLFQLAVNRDWMPYDDKLKHVVNSLDFSNISLPGQENDEQPYFFMAVINPFNLKKASVTAMYKRDYNGDPIDYSLHDKTGPGYELLGVVGKLTDLASRSVGKALNLIVKKQLKPKKNEIGTLGETFDYTTPRKDTLGAAIGVQLSDVPKVLDLLIDEQTSGKPAPLIFACRFVRPSGGTLEFTQHDPTCVIDIDGVNSKRSRDFLSRIWPKLDQNRIKYTQHWGKINNYDNVNVRKRYGDAKVDSWRKARSALLGSKANKALFDSPFLKDIGLSDL